MNNTLEVVILIFLIFFGIGAIIVMSVAIFELVHGRREERRESKELRELYQVPVTVDLEIESSAPITINGQSINPGHGTVSMLVRRPELDAEGSYETSLTKMTDKNRALILQVERELKTIPGITCRRDGPRYVFNINGLTFANLGVVKGVGRLYVFDHSLGETKEGKFFRFVLDNTKTVTEGITAAKQACNNARTAKKAA